MTTPESLRLSAGLNLNELARLAGVDDSTIAHIEQGKTVRLRAKTLENIGVALKQRFAELGQEFKLSQYIEAAIAHRDRMWTVRATAKRRAG